METLQKNKTICRNIIQNICLVCDYLTTRTTYKKHGGYNVYEDDKIITTKDTYVPNTDLYVKVGGSKVIVFSASYNGTVYQYNPGAWELYLTKLVGKALIEKGMREHEAIEIKNAALQKNFGPVSDEINNVFKN